jgi:hypothetical protein
MSAAIAPSPLSSPSLSRMLHDCTAHCSLHFSGWIQNAGQALHTTPALPAAIPSRSKPCQQPRIASARDQRDAAAALQRLGGSSLRHKGTLQHKASRRRRRYCRGWSNYRNLVLGLVCRATPSLGAAACVLAAFPVLLRCEVSLLLLCF